MVLELMRGADLEVTSRKYAVTAATPRQKLFGQNDPPGLRP